MILVSFWSLWWGATMFVTSFVVLLCFPWSLKSSLFSVFPIVLILFLFLVAIFEATGVIYVYCVAGMMENIKCLPCGSLQNESRFLWLRRGFYTCFVKNFSGQMLHLFEAILSLYCCSLYELYLATTHVSNTYSNNQKDQSQWNVKCYCNASVSSASDRQKHIRTKWEQR